MLHEIFEEAVKEFPNRIAIQFEDEKPLTYEQLDQLANQLANYFLEQNIAPQQYVILHLSRSIWQVAAFLALQKIGAVPIPVSSEQPPSRIQNIQEDCKTDFIITTSNLHEQIAPHIKGFITSILLDYQKNFCNQPKTHPKVQRLTDDNLGYIAYSSGTTGRPKGIPIKHSGLMHWAKELKHHIKHPVDRVLANTGLDFDAHIWEYEMAWVFGAALHITKEDTRKDGDRLAEFIIKHRISDMTLTPAVLKSFRNEYIERFKSSGLRAIYSTGEECTLDLISRFIKFNFFNCYGPTELTFGLSMILCDLSKFHDKLAPINIPHPDSGIKIQVVDKDEKEVKPGTAGELVVFSPHLTPGYLNRPGENKKFIKKDHSSIRGYKTGDKVICLNDTLYYLGRIHELAHVKIRGQFVTIEGIETVLKKYPHAKITDAYVVVRNDLGRELMLAAFLVTDETPSLTELRRYCSSLLAPSSIPSFFITITNRELPLTINKKVDREALTKKEFHFKRDKSIPYISTTFDYEKQLIQIWETIFQFPPSLKISIGVTDTFAMLGGDSIKSMILIGKIKDHFHLNLLASKIGSLEELTIRKLATLICVELTLKQGDKIMQPIKTGKDNIPPLFFLPPIFGESFNTYYVLSNVLKTPRTVIALDSPVLNNPKLVGSSIQAMAEPYLALIRSIQPKGPVHVMGWSSGGILAYEIAALLEEKGTLPGFVGIIDEIAPKLQHSVSAAEHAEQLIELMNYFSDRYGVQFNLNPQKLRTLTKLDQIEQVFQNVAAPKDKASENKTIRNMLYHVKLFMTNFLQYKPRKLEKTPVTVFRTEDTLKKVSYLTKSPNEIDSLGWNKYSTAYTTICELKGNHFSIMQSPDELASKIDLCVRDMSFNNSDQLLIEIYETIKKFEGAARNLFQNNPDYNLSTLPTLFKKNNLKTLKENDSPGHTVIRHKL